MTNIKQKALDFFKSNANIKEVYGTNDGFLFLKKQDALFHAKTLSADNPQVEAFTNAKDTAAEHRNPTPAELKELKDNAVAEYTGLFGTAPDKKLSAKEITKLIETKKVELQNQNPQ